MVGLALGEANEIATQRFSGDSLLAFAYLVVPGSIIAYIAFAWLLANAPISTVSTYAYVNPLVAVLLGWALRLRDRSHPPGSPPAPPPYSPPSPSSSATHTAPLKRRTERRQLTLPL